MILFSLYWYTSFWNFEINPMNTNIQKHFENVVTNIFKATFNQKNIIITS